MARSSVGCSPQHQFLGRRPLRGCQNRVEEDNIVLIDIESDNCENVVVIDIPDSFPTKFGGGSESSRRGKKAETSWTSVICLDDDDDDDDDEDTDDTSDEDCVINEVNVNNNSSFSGKSNPPASGNSGSSSDTNLDGCQFDQESATPLKLSKGKRTYSGKRSAENHFGVYDVDDLSCDDFIDCDLMEDSCGSVKEMWEKANSKRKCDPRNGQPAQGDFNKNTNDACNSVNASTDCGQCEEPPSMTKQAEDEGEASSIHKNKDNLDYTADESLNATHDGVEDGLLESILNGIDTHYTRRSSFDFAECFNCNFPEPNSSEFPSMEEQNLKEPYSSPCLGKDTEKVNHANKPFHDNTEVPLRDSCLSRSESCARENVCDHEKTNLFHGASLYNQSVDSELADQNGSLPEESRSPSLQRDPNSTSSSHEKSIHKYANENKTVPVEIFSNKSSVCIDETSNQKDSIQFDMEQIDDRSSIFRSDTNEVLSVNNPNQQDDQPNDSVHGQDCVTAQSDDFFIISGREKFKETEEYKKATEEEWASRQRALQIQSEEAQNLRRLRKRMKAQTMRIVDMEKRQKQRLEEIRETEKKDQENSNLRDIIRAEVRRDLNMLEVTCFDMASLLRRLGIPVGGDGGGLLSPSLSEVRVAYKRALLAFHPDRASRTDMRLQVEAEEKFKLISRMKERLLPSF